MGKPIVIHPSACAYEEHLSKEMYILSQGNVHTRSSIMGGRPNLGSLILDMINMTRRQVGRQMSERKNGGMRNMKQGNHET